MSKYYNRRFLSEYIKLDKACSDRFGIANGGVSEYITRLGSNTSIEGREEPLSRLVRYRGYRNKLAHEVSALERFSGIVRADVKWIVSFTRSVKLKRDPVSLFIKNERKKTGWYKFKRAAIISLSAIALIAVLLFLIYLGAK